METVQIELKNKNALSILKSLEKANMIKLLPTEKHTKNSPIHFKGSITSERVIELANEIEKSRNDGETKGKKGLFLSELAEAVEEMKQIKKGKIQPRYAEDFLNEL